MFWWIKVSHTPIKWLSDQPWPLSSISPAYPVYHWIDPGPGRTFRQRATKTAAKIKSRNNIIAKLATDTSWGTNAQTIRSAAVALCYSCSCMRRSSDAKLINRQLNETMCIISGTLHPPPPQWLPVLSHIAPLAILRTISNCKVHPDHNMQVKPHFLVYSDIFHHPTSRLQSYRPIWSADTGSSMKELWREMWDANPPVNSFITDDPTALVPGSDLPRREQSRLNRLYWQPAVHLRWHSIYTSHILNVCPVNKFKDGLAAIHAVSDSAEWLRRSVNCIR